MIETPLPFFFSGISSKSPSIKLIARRDKSKDGFGECFGLLGTNGAGTYSYILFMSFSS
jgi:hypothetical protein